MLYALVMYPEMLHRDTMLMTATRKCHESKERKEKKSRQGVSGHGRHLPAPTRMSVSFEAEQGNKLQPIADEPEVAAGPPYAVDTLEEWM
jgi:hypothetical protein